MSIDYAYHVSHEQFSPKDLLKYVQQAEQAGFTAAFSSDHMQPWSEKQGESGFSWAWLGAAMQATNLPFGMINAPGYRYHPAVVAQASATLAQMFPGRFWMALGSGQALNEKLTGVRWPAKEKRNEILKECAQLIRQLHKGEKVTHYGNVILEQAKVHSLPDQPIPIIGAAVTDKTAGWVGSWADGLITISKPLDELKETVRQFRMGGGEGKPMYIKVQLSYAKSYDKALQNAFEQWRNNIFKSPALTELSTPEQFDAMGEFTRPEDVARMVNVSADPEQHIEWLQQYIELGFSKLILHNVGLNQEEYIQTFGTKVLPVLKEKYR